MCSLYIMGMTKHVLQIVRKAPPAVVSDSRGLFISELGEDRGQCFGAVSNIDTATLDGWREDIEGGLQRLGFVDVPAFSLAVGRDFVLAFWSGGPRVLEGGALDGVEAGDAVLPQLVFVPDQESGHDIMARAARMREDAISLRRFLDMPSSIVMVDFPEPAFRSGGLFSGSVNKTKYLQKEYKESIINEIKIQENYISKELYNFEYKNLDLIPVENIPHNKAKGGIEGFLAGLASLEFKTGQAHIKSSPCIKKSPTKPLSSLVENAYDIIKGFRHPGGR